MRNKRSKRADKALDKMGLTSETVSSKALEEECATDHERVISIPIVAIRTCPFQARRAFDEEKLKALAASIQGKGMIQPIVVRRRGGSAEYELIAGERRLRAAVLANMRAIPAIVRDVSDAETRLLTLVENFQREDLNVAEKTKAIGLLVDEIPDTGLIALELDLTRRSVERYIRIYRAVYASPALGSLFEKHTKHIDFAAAKAMAILAEKFAQSAVTLNKFCGLAEKEGIKRAIKQFIRRGESRTGGKSDALFNIAARKDSLVFTVRMPRSQETAPDVRREIQAGLEQFFARLGKDGTQ